MGAWGETPDPFASRVQGQSPWLGCQGGAKPPEADEVVIPGKKINVQVEGGNLGN